MTVLLVILYVFVCIFLILVVLLQQGKGADLAGAFGGGGSQTSFGPRGGANIMHRLTTGFFVVFVVLSMALAILSGKARTSVMEDVETVPQTEATGQVIESAEPGDPAAALAPEEGTVEVEGGDAEAVPEATEGEDIPSAVD